MFMIRGNFYVHSNLTILEQGEGLSRNDIASVAPKNFDSGMYIVISRTSFKSLIDSYLDPASNLYLESKVEYSVDDLDSLIEGFSNAFEDN